MDLVAVLLNYNEGEAERRLVVCSAYLPNDSEDPPLMIVKRKASI